MSPGRWLYHLLPASQPTPAAALDHAPTDGVARWAPASLAEEGFVHASFRDQVEESARLHFAAGLPLDVLRIDPRRLDVPLVLAEGPRGRFPHLHGPIALAAIVERLPLAALAGAPDAIE